MVLEDALTRATALAKICEARLGERIFTRAAGADPNSSYWAFLFVAPDCPPKWLWLINVNDRCEPEIIIAHNPSEPQKSQNQTDALPRG